MDKLVLNEITSNVLLEAMEANMFGYMRYYANQSPSMEIIDKDDLLIINSGVPSDTFNYICRAKFAEDKLHRRIDEAVDYFKSKNLPFTWWVGPSSEPSNLGSYLENHRLKCTEAELGMAADLRELPNHYPLPKDLTIKRITTIDELNQFAQVIASVFEPPDSAVQLFYKQVSELAIKQDRPMHLYLGYLHEKPVSTSALFLEAGVAGIYSIATIKQARKQGIGTALTLVVLQDAREQGYQIATLQASQDGQNLYARLGFKACCQFFTYQ